MGGSAEKGRWGSETAEGPVSERLQARYHLDYEVVTQSCMNKKRGLVPEC